MPLREITSAIVRTQQAEAGRWRGLIVRAWAFYFAHRPIIVLCMALYLLLIHVTAAALFWDSRWPGIIAWKLGVATRWAEFDQSYKERSLQLRRLADALDPGAVLFIGDSLLASLDIGALTNRPVQLSIGGETTARVQARIGVYQALRDAQLVFFHVGTNDLRYRTPDNMRRPMTRVLSKVPTHVPVIMSAILPIDERVFNLYTNADIAAANTVLEQVCQARSGCRFVRTGHSLVDASGNLDPRYYTRDGLHLNSAGYRLWRAELLPILAPWRSF